ncbi:MAG: tetratricopeptide repeat protein [Myxococcota bacterium]|nr:tetratricopeptide repeat protein [Myxococcota bacterium]
MSEHPDAGVRTTAAWLLMYHARLMGRPDLFAVGQKYVRFMPKFSFIGPFENDQGKGADAVYGPEREIDFKRVYKDRRGPIGWRTEIPIQPSGKVDLAELYYPSKWRVAYGVTAVESSVGGAYELRIGTADGIKVWLNDELVFNNRKIAGFEFDGLVIPVTLRKGANRILIKSVQGTGQWQLVARITKPGGLLPEPGQLSQLANDTPIQRAVKATNRLATIDELLDKQLANIEPPIRRRVHKIMALRRLKMNAAAVESAEQLMTSNPKSLIGRTELAVALWGNSERGRTADMLDSLNSAVGDKWLQLGLWQARFWQQQKMHDKARKLLRTMVKAHPTVVKARLTLADAYKRERWHAERCSILKTIMSDIADWPSVMQKVADCLEDQRFYSEAQAIYERVLKLIPNSPSTLASLYWHALGNEKHATAIAYAERFIEAFPNERAGWMRLAEAHRRTRDTSEARAALVQAAQITPRHPDPYVKLGSVALQSNETDTAVGAWKEALARNPDDQTLMSRVDWLSPETVGPWMDDVPSLDAIRKAVATAKDQALQPGADVLYLMDDEVSLLNADGSSSNVVTTVAIGLNQSGRDRLTKLRLRSGRHKIFMAFALDPTGKRQEASSIRRNTVRFRQLSIGSVVVLQYRVDERADGYLAGYMGKAWWFQSPGAQVARSRWVLWMPPESKLNQRVSGEGVSHTVNLVGDYRRHQWVSIDQPPVLREPRMPPLRDVGLHLTVSTVPSWDMFFKWEEALLVDAFRDSPEVQAVANSLRDDDASKDELVKRIHAYVMGKIRYQQDYEGFIAGVKPHPAPMVIARQYGDCKDKAVLFITLARLLGIEVHFALVRTRDAGAVVKSVPMQQFNHAIVYVPKQKGLETARFYDPTVDALDVNSLRHDDQGTWSVVYNPVTKEHTWRQIPFQDPNVDVEHTTMTAKLSPSGDVEGRINLTAHGRGAEYLRKAARNPDVLKRLLTRLTVQDALPSARIGKHDLKDVVDVFKPAVLEWGFTGEKAATRDGLHLRWRVPISWKPSNGFVLQDRQYPVVLGIPRTLKHSVELKLPSGAQVERLPASLKLETRCLAFERTVTDKKDRILISQTVRYRCERIPPSEYEENRHLASTLTKAVADAILIKAPARVIAQH